MNDSTGFLANVNEVFEEYCILKSRIIETEMQVYTAALNYAPRIRDCCHAYNEYRLAILSSLRAQCFETMAYASENYSSYFKFVHMFTILYDEEMSMHRDYMCLIYCNLFAYNIGAYDTMFAPVIYTDIKLNINDINDQKKYTTNKEITI